MAVFFASLAVFVLVAPWDPDPHHDGFQIAVAIGVLDGRVLYAEVFDQYGPLTAWVQAAALWMFGPELVIIRYQTAVVLAAVAALLAVVVKRYSRSTVLALIIAAAWVAACPVWAVYPGLFPLWPWPSAVLAVLMLSSLVAFELGRSGSHWGSVASGGLVAAAIMTRWPSGLLLIAVFVVSMVWFRSSVGRVKLATYWSGGFVAALSVFVLVVTVQGALPDLVYQTVTQPFNVYTKGSDLSWLTLYYGFGSGAILMIAASACTVFLSGSRLVRAVAGGAGLAVAAVAMHLGIAQQPAWAARGLGVPESVVGAADVLGESVVIVAAVATPFVAAALFLGRRGFSSALSSIGPLGGVAITTLAQLYPVADMYHLWWAAPPCLAFVAVSFFSLINGRVSQGWLVIAVIVAVPTMIGALGFRQAMATERVEVTTGVLRGMDVPTERMSSVTALERAVLRGPGAGARRFVCRDGLVSVFSGRYLPDSAAFVDWAWLRPVKTVTPEANLTVLCAPDLAYGRSMAATLGGQVVYESPEPIAMSPWSQFYVLVLDDSRLSLGS